MIVVIGGGIIGLAVAWRAAQAGLEVTVCDPSAATGGASHAAAGMLCPVSEAHYGEEALLALNLASSTRWPAFAAELAEASGLEVPLRRNGSLLVAFDADDLRSLGELARFQSGLGLSATRLASRDARALEPMLSPRIRGAVAVDDEANVDNRAACRALLVAAERAGVRLVRDRVAEVLVGGGRSGAGSAGGHAVAGVGEAGGDAAAGVGEAGGDGAGGSGSADGDRVARVGGVCREGGDRVTGVRLAGGGTIAAEQVVVAAGPWSGLLGGLPPEVVPPVRPVKGQILRLRFDPAAPPVTRNIRALARGWSVYLVPRGDGELVVGATVEERGFDTTVTAGPVRELLEAAIDVVPALSELELVETLARLRPATPDNAPVIGPTSLGGLVLATGHHRNGILLAPVTADAVVDLLVDGKLPAEAEPFTIGRFGR